jgi:hypothetical protein
VFSPYHKFGNCSLLRRSINNLRISGSVSKEILAAHNKFHYAIEQKLLSAKYYVEALEELLKSSNLSADKDGMKELLFKVNMYADGFFMTSGSALDILAHEILSYYNIALPRNVYFSTAHREISSNRAGDSILLKLTEPTWKSEFSDYRNALTHEVLVAVSYSVNRTHDGPNVKSEIIFPLPDDPRVPITDRTYDRNKNIVEYEKNILLKILRLINTIYGEVNTKLRATGALPI